MRTILILVALLKISGCATWIEDKKSELARIGPSTQFDTEKTKTYAEEQKVVYDQLKNMTGVQNPSEDQIIVSGLQYADTLCSDYLESLYWVNKQLKADIRDVNSLGTLTSGAMGLAKSSASSIAGAAILFGYTEESMNNLGSRILFELEPSSG